MNGATRRLHPQGAMELGRELDKLLSDTAAARLGCEASRSVGAEVWEQVLVRVARELLDRPGKQLRGRLVELAFSLGGGQSAHLSPSLPHLVELLHAGSLIVDDVQDDAMVRRGAPAVHRAYGVPIAINTGNWLYYAASELVDRSGLSAELALQVYRSLSRTMFRSHQGQALDLALDVTELRQRDVARLAEASASLKTGELMYFAAELGASAAGASPSDRTWLSDFGRTIGVALQHLDDLGGLRRSVRRAKGREDLVNRRLSWAWACLASKLDEVTFRGLQVRLRGARPDELDGFARDMVVLLGSAPYEAACVKLQRAHRAGAAVSEPSSGARPRGRARRPGARPWLAYDRGGIRGDRTG